MLIRRMRPVLVALLVALLSSAFAVGASANQRTDELVKQAMENLHVADDVLHHNEFTGDDRDFVIDRVNETLQLLTEYKFQSR
jgi:hypothetical protein